MQNDKEIADIVREFCLDAGYEFYPDYSGRGMYGRKCIGISHRDTTANVITRLAAHLIESVNDDAIDNAIVILRRLKDARQDSLGLGTITYWPNIEAADASEN
nr:MAG TPA: hypothetical protein [Caudoviricetes sp.]